MSDNMVPAVQPEAGDGQGIKWQREPEKSVPETNAKFALLETLLAADDPSAESVLNAYSEFAAAQYHSDGLEFKKTDSSETMDEGVDEDLVR